MKRRLITTIAALFIIFNFSSCFTLSYLYLSDNNVWDTKYWYVENFKISSYIDNRYDIYLFKNKYQLSNFILNKLAYRQSSSDSYIEYIASLMDNFIIENFNTSDDGEFFYKVNDRFIEKLKNDTESLFACYWTGNSKNKTNLVMFLKKTNSGDIRYCCLNRDIFYEF